MQLITWALKKIALSALYSRLKKIVIEKIWSRIKARP